MEKDHGVDFGVETGGTMIVSDSSPFDLLPEGCISNIISFTIKSPRDACVAASVSKTFESAANSDSVWEKFLPPHYQSLIPPSRIFSSKKELYFTLCNESVLIEDGKMSLWLDKGSGKRCIMLSTTANHFEITWGDSPDFWQWISIPESRFEKVPELLVECPFRIHGVIKARILSPRIRYSAYIVYKTRDGFHDFENLGVGFIGQGTHPAKHWQREYLTNMKEREDEWMEVQFGEFFNEGGLRDDRNEIVLHVAEINDSYWKRGFIIQGIELRPVKSW